NQRFFCLVQKDFARLCIKFSTFLLKLLFRGYGFLEGLRLAAWFLRGGAVLEIWGGFGKK
ncbi:hypothetical protein, partial [Vibrio parahaemolyticus]|uniref:hypothetical protein n=1 Tax=Vibrio parahaemolyticus TaxID=670 RepID=UPI001C25DA88